MQVVSPSSPAARFVGKERFAELYGKLNDDFSSKLKVGATEKEEKESDEEGEGEEEGDEFSFASVNGENSPITADEAFEDGQIRPVYPFFNRNLLFEPDAKESLRSPLKKVFVEREEAAATTAGEEESVPIGPYCSWSGRTVEEASPKTCRKSNSTGFSKLWRFRDLVSRSKSDGKDAFVFLSNGSSSSSHSSPSTAAAKPNGAKRAEKEKKKTRTKSAHERLYMRNRAIREEGKRRSYLPYKHVGFFTNVNGLTRNVHPY
ncbi:hypothetical protein Bca4012_027598 [Brassica carinata]|uniref:Uncharacterized protein n=1 Tax=Brassica carinata TaxID=52824 RepID=A0A8X7VKQ5_BRACI|nr:hypothetical protein Bca52824_024566 [Brassica carinata]